MAIRMTTGFIAADRSRLRTPRYAGAGQWPHVGECGRAGAVIDTVKQRNGGGVSAAGDAIR